MEWVLKADLARRTELVLEVKKNMLQEIKQWRQELLESLVGFDFSDSEIYIQNKENINQVCTIIDILNVFEEFLLRENTFMEYVTVTDQGTSKETTQFVLSIENLSMLHDGCNSCAGIPNPVHVFVYDIISTGGLVGTALMFRDEYFDRYFFSALDYLTYKSYVQETAIFDND